MQGIGGISQGAAPPKKQEVQAYNPFSDGVKPAGGAKAVDANDRNLSATH